MSISAASWHVVQTRPRSEDKAALHLQRQGFEVYLPRYLKRRSHARKVDFVPTPLFPQYVFVAVDLLTQRWRAVNSTVGVTRLICHGQLPVEVPRSVVDGLRRRHDAGGFVRQHRDVLTPGQKIRVRDGAFSDFLGSFESMNDGERVAVLLDLLGRKVRVVMSADVIEAA
jgi:transcriptional antiterminator RfaH